MNIEDNYPGRLIYNLRVVHQPRSMHVELTSNEQPSQMYHLDYRYYNGNIEDLREGDVLQGPFVVLDLKDNGYLTAQVGYFDILFSHIYPDGWDTAVTKIPWMAHWKKIFLPNFAPDKLTFASYPQKDALELTTPWAVIPLRVSSFLRFIDKKPVVYPDNLLSSEKIKNAQYAAYCSDENVNWPLFYTATFHGRGLKVKINKTVRVCLHGFLDPLQNHYKLWKHITDDLRVVMNSDALNRWSKYTGVSIPLTLKNVIFKQCEPPVPYKPNQVPTRCSRKCQPKNFKDVNRKLEFWNRKYLQSAVTFFEKNPTNEIVIVEGDHPGIVEFEQVGFFEVVDCYGEKRPSFVRLVLKGYCYNWNDESEPPLIHLHITTFFVDKKNGEPFNLRKPEKRLVALGRLHSIQSVEKEVK